MVGTWAVVMVDETAACSGCSTDGVRVVLRVCEWAVWWVAWRVGGMVGGMAGR